MIEIISDQKPTNADRIRRLLLPTPGTFNNSPGRLPDGSRTIPGTHKKPIQSEGVIAWKTDAYAAEKSFRKGSRCAKRA